MEDTKMMIPLFFNGNFNREGRKMRVVLVRKISDGTQTYCLWQKNGKPDRKFPNAENDRYSLYVEANGYILPLGMTDYFLVNHCGYEPMAKKMYGGVEERRKYWEELRKAGRDNEIPAILEKEQKEIEKFGCDPAIQTKYIRSILDEHVTAYLESKENGGQTFPDFAGALIMNDLVQCTELSAIYQAKKQEKTTAWKDRIAKEEKVRHETKNQEAEQVLSAAIEVILNGGTLENSSVDFYENMENYRKYDIISYLMRLYRVEAPLRTQGWINGKLCSCKVKDGKCVGINYLRGKKNSFSQKFFQCMDTLVASVVESPDKWKEEFQKWTAAKQRE